MGRLLDWWVLRAARTIGSAGLLATVAVRVTGRTVPWSSAAIGFMPMVAPGLTALTAVSAARRERVRTLVLGAAAAQATALVADRARRTPQPVVHGGRRVRVMSSNVYKGRADAAALAALVREHEPDILAIQEQTPRFIERLDAAGLAELLPYRVIGDGGRQADGSVFSRHPLDAIGPELPSEYVAAAVGLPGGAPVPFICAHPFPPAAPRWEAMWIRSLEQLPGSTGWMAGGLVSGDFNATVDHPEFLACLARGWRDAGSELGRGLRPTWGGRGFLRLTIDHILAPPGAAITGYEVLPLAGSDHRTIVATIQLPG